MVLINIIFQITIILSILVIKNLKDLYGYDFENCTCILEILAFVYNITGINLI